MKIKSILLVYFLLSMNGVVAQQVTGVDADYFARKITVSASGASGKQQDSIAQKRVWAQTEARKNCYTMAAQAVGDLSVEGITFLKAGQLVQQDFSIAINKYIRGVKTIKETYETLGDGSIQARVTMTLNFDGNNGLNRLLYNSLFYGKKKDFLSPSKRINKALANFTGVVIDTRGHNVEPSMTPRIYDVTGKLIYGPDHVDREYAFRTGIVGYTKDLKNVTARIGKNPLKIDVESRISRDHSSVLVSQKMGELLLQLEHNFGILSKCKIAFWVN